MRDHAGMESEAGRRSTTARRALGLAVALGALMAFGSATARPQGLPTHALLPLPLLPPLPGVPLRIGTPPSDSQPPSPPRPSRSPPSYCSGKSAPGPVSYAQPVFPCDFSDPMVLKTRHAWFAYATAAGWEHGTQSFPILRSEDLRHWRFVGDALGRPPGWAAGDLWGPGVLAWRGSYLLYYNALSTGTDLHCLAVAVASRPHGPFQPEGRIACQFGQLRGFIDPAPLVAPGRRLYLFFSVDSPEHSISALRLSADGCAQSAQHAGC